jgi:phage regulator Rha-like protein
MTTLVPIELIANKIYLIRGVKVMLDKDLAELYGVETKRLKEQVRRNIERFPADFRFDLTKEEIKNLRSQFATSSWGGTRYLPMAFTEQGVAMLSSVLRSKRAIQANIQIMRTFTKLREALLDNKDLRSELEGVKQITEERFRIVFETLDQLLTVESKPKKKIGYTVKEKQKAYANRG